MDRLLIIDESLNPRLASQLKKRGRIARSVAELRYRGMKDPLLLRTLAVDYPAAVLITADDNMPADHRAVLRETAVTLATIDPARPSKLTQEEWETEVVQRWVHRMAVQTSATWYRYGRTARLWTPRRKPRSERA